MRGVTDDYEFFLLDLDGTLVDVESSYVHEVFAEVGDRLGYDFTDRQAETIWYGFCDSRDDQLRRWGLDRDAFWATFDEIESPDSRVEATYLHEDAAVVSDVDAPRGLVTHCRADLTAHVLDELDIGDWFDTVVCCTDDLGWKPDPGPVRRAMTDLGVEGSRGVLTGDSAADVGAAWNAGIDAVHVERHGHDLRGQCVLADHRVERLDDL